MHRVVVTAALLLASASFAFADCSLKVGAKASFTSVDTLQENLSARGGKHLEKDEFETEKQFRARTSKLNKDLRKEIYLVEVKNPHAQPTYEAEEQRFKISQDVWYPLFFSFNENVTSTGHKLLFESRDKPVSSYEAANAFGAATTVSIVDRVNYSIFDRPAARMDEPTWKTDYIEYRDRGVYLKMPGDKARALNGKLRFAVEFSPKAPLVIEEKSVSTPTFKYPTQYRTTMHLFFGDLRCAVITDEAGTVLRNVPVAY